MKSSVFIGICLFFCGVFGLQNCRPAGAADAEKPREWLSEYGFFVGELNKLEPANGVLPYDLNTPLFSDYAQKARFVRLPEGQPARYDSTDVLDFPVGSILIKNFFYNTDERHPEKGRKIIETRLLIHQKNGWDARAYVWNEDQTDARLNNIGGIHPVEWTNAAGELVRLDYIVPNRNQCKGCHAFDGKLIPIGPKAGNLDRSFDYADGTENQLVKWSQTGRLAGFDPQYPPRRYAVWNDPDSGNIHDRAMAYLDVNCGHCHNPHGAAYTSGLNLSLRQPSDIQLGIFKAPVATGKGSGGRAYTIVPGDPDASILVYRMESLDPGAMMPEVGRRMIHKEGVALIRQWIADMESVSPN
ncbi:MAG: hypothetical protein D6714_00105 [Bacteroidetes bacterium]|nr:MAG: hypothetical protein D6714_00105 [Bacteroidota bacterium]